MTALWWIRRDLRLNDNKTLQKALEHNRILPVFIQDPIFEKGTPNRRQQFLWQNLKELASDLQSRGSYLVVRKGKPVRVLKALLEETGAEIIYAEEDYTPYDRLRSVLVGGALPLKLVQGQLGLHPLANLKKNDTPYTVYSPFKRSWLALFPQIELKSAPDRIPTIPDILSDPLPAGKEHELFPAGETFARKRLSNFLQSGIFSYHQTRDRLDQFGTSQLSPYIHFGILGLQTALEEVRVLLDEQIGDKDRQGVQVWLSELIWREFYIHILYHFPHVRTENFRSRYDHIKWRNDPDDFQAWKDGRTGYPVVDAGMKQLKSSGWMHNRARMITASFLVKHLLIDWRWGEQYFRELLIDGDLAANNGGWQWIAGTSTDASPYFRIFNPILQGQKYDPQGSYIHRWVPELAHLQGKKLHTPWKYELESNDYPKPIVDHRFARERALIAYKSNGP